MRSRLATLVLLLLAAWLLYDYARTEDAHSVPPPEGGLLFPGLEPRDISVISMNWESGHQLDIERDDSAAPWQITYPTEELAQAEFVEVLLDNLARAKVLPVGEQGVEIDPTNVGLDPPKYTISFGRGEHRATLFIGERDAYRTGVYARRAGDEDVVLTTLNLLTMFEQFRNQDFADKHLLRGLRGGINTVRVERPDGVLLDAIREGGGWTLREPVPGQADAARIGQLVRELQFIEQREVAGFEPPDADLAQLGLPNALQIARGDWNGATMIALGASGEVPARVFLQERWIETGDDTYAIREDLKRLLVIDRNMLNLLVNGPDFFRDRRLLPPVKERARSLRVERDGMVLLDIRGDDRGRWEFRAPERLAGDAVDTQRTDGRSSLSDALGVLDALEADGFADPATIDGTEPDAQVTVEWNQSGILRRDRLDLFAQDDGRWLVRPSHRPAELLVAPDGLAALFDPGFADRLRSLAPVDIAPEAWGGLRLSVPDAPEPFLLERDHAGANAEWRGDDAWGRRIGYGLGLLEGLRGYRWQPRRSGVEYPWRVELLGFDGELLGALDLRRPGPGDEPEAFGHPVVYASWSGTADLELVLNRVWIDQLDALLQAQARTETPQLQADG